MRRVPSHRAIAGAFATPLVGLLILTLVGCPQRREPPPVESGVVVDVNPVPGRRVDFITVRYRDGFLGRYRVSRGACPDGADYPACVEDQPPE